MIDRNRDRSVTSDQRDSKEKAISKVNDRFNSPMKEESQH